MAPVLEDVVKPKADPVVVAFVGAGLITFGAPSVVWNHSARIESILGDRLEVAAIIDPNRARYDQIMTEKAEGSHAKAYESTRYFANPAEAAAALKSKVDLCILASPPHFRGTTLEGRDLELEMIRLFGTQMQTYFVEKPVATTRPDEPIEVASLLRTQAPEATVGIGYMMRYLKVVQKVKSIIKENNLKVMLVTGRYAMAYNLESKAPWWMKSQQGGPIIEQGTHFCDLMRYLGGEVVLDSVQATTLEHNEPAGEIDLKLIDESKIEPEDRVPRSTAAFWKFASGALGSLTHVIALHGVGYSNEISVYADGYQFRINDVYTNPVLHVRTPVSDTKEQVFSYPEDDMFYNEFYAFLSAAIVRSGKTPLEFQSNHDLLSKQILSTYEDACQTFLLTWRIRDISDEVGRKSREAMTEDQKLEVAKATARRAVHAKTAVLDVK